MSKLSIIGFILLIVTNLFSQVNGSFSMDAAKLYALENNLNVLNAANDVQIAHQQYVETLGIGLPQVQASGNFSNFLNLPVQVVDASFINPSALPGETISFKAGTDYTTTGSLQINQLLFNGSYLVGLQVAKFYNEFQKSISSRTEEEVVFNVIQAYQMAAIAKTNLFFSDSIFLTTQELVNKQKHYYELGFITKEDFDQLNFSLIATKSALNSAKKHYNNSLAMLKLTMGYPMDELIEITDSHEQLISKNNISDGNIHDNINYSLHQKQLTLSTYNLKNQRYSALPTVNAFFQQTYNAFRNDFDFFENKPWYPQTVWGIQLSIPIYSGGQRYAKIQQANIKLINDQNNLVLLEQRLKFEEIHFQNNLQNALNSFELQKENIKLAKSIYQNAIVKEEIGKGNSILVTQKHNQLMIAQTEYIASLVALFQAKLSLDKLYNKILSNNNL